MNSTTLKLRQATYFFVRKKERKKENERKKALKEKEINKMRTKQFSNFLLIIKKVKARKSAK